MRRKIILGILGLGLLGGCVVYTPPPAAVVVPAGPPPGYVEVVPVRPYPSAVWIAGGWGYYHRGWVYHRGYWR